MADPRTSTLQRDLDRVAVLVGDEVTARFRAADLDNIDRWFDSNVASIERTVATGHRATAQLGAAYMSDMAQQAGHVITPIVAEPDTRRIRESLRVTGPVAFKNNIGRTGSVETARRMMLLRSGRSAERLTLAGSRDSVTETIAAERVIVGYRRVTQPGACDFCKMLAGRGAVYSADTVVRVGQRPRGNQRAGRSYHDSCRCAPEPVFASSRVTPSPEARAEARAGNQRRREAIEAARAAAKELARQQAAATAGGPVDEALLARWGVTEQQLLNARSQVKAIKADMRAIAARQADELGAWLSDNSLDQITRPERLRRQTDIVTGARRSVRDQSGYDFLETLGDAETARVRKRMTESDLFAPDVLAEQVRRVTNLDLSDDEAIDWVIERWLQEDGLRSLASGRIPRYADPDNLIPADYGLEGYRIEQLFSVDLDDAAGHVAQIQREGAQQYAQRTLGNPTNGPRPWEMDFNDYVQELEEIEDVLSTTQVAAGVDPGGAYRQAQARLRELAPPDIDPEGNTNPAELFERVRLTAQTADLM